MPLERLVQTVCTHILPHLAKRWGRVGFFFFFFFLSPRGTYLGLIMQQSDRNAHSDHINHRAPDAELNRSSLEQCGRAPSTSSLLAPRKVYHLARGVIRCRIYRELSIRMSMAGHLASIIPRADQWSFSGTRPQKNESFYMDREWAMRWVEWGVVVEGVLVKGKHDAPLGGHRDVEQLNCHPTKPNFTAGS